MRAGWAELARQYRPLLIAAPLVLLVLAVIVFREQISHRLIPDPRMNQQLELAQAALQRGDLTRADGRGARELFEAALATDPDQIAAREGLQQVREAAIARADQNLRQHRLAPARQDLALAKALSAPEVDLQPLQARLHELENASGDVGKLFQRAQDPNLSDAQVLALYEQVLTIAPENAQALDARAQILSRWLLEAEKLLHAGQVGKAQARVAEVVAHDPAHLDLPAVQAELGEAIAHMQQQQPQWLREANGQLQHGQCQRAVENFQRVLALGPEPSANEGLQRCAQIMAEQAERQAADFDFRRAEQSLALARTWSAESPAVAAAGRRIAQSRMSQRRLSAVPPSKDRTRLPNLLEQARVALDHGDFIIPPGESAWDKLRIAAAIAPKDKRVRQLQVDYRARTRSCFEQAMTDNRLLRAQSCLDARLALDPAGGAHGDQHRLAERWLGFAEERIAASDFSAAAKALAAARQLEPGNARWPVLSARLKQAQGQP
jgi:hypothetical protein